MDKNALKLFFLVDSGYTADVRLLSVVPVFKFSLFCGLNTSVRFIFTLRGLKCLYILFVHWKNWTEINDLEVKVTNIEYWYRIPMLSI